MDDGGAGEGGSERKLSPGGAEPEGRLGGGRAGSGGCPRSEGRLGGVWGSFVRGGKWGGSDGESFPNTTPAPRSPPADLRRSETSRVVL